jgi:hypothetical protein
MKNSPSIRILSRALTFFFPVFLTFLTPIVFAVYKFGFTWQNIKFPLYFYGDEMLYATSVLSFSKGTALFNSNFGGFSGQELDFAFLSVDSGPTLIAGIISNLAGENPFFGMNVLFILGYGLTALSGYFATRIFGVKGTIAIPAGIIMAILPFHLLWNTNSPTISSYFLLPILFALSIKKVFFETSKKERIFLYVLVFLNGAWYSYYSIGYTFLLITLVIITSLVERSIDKVKASISLLIINTSSFLIVAVPALIAKSRAINVDYFGERDPWAAIVNATTLLHYTTPFPTSIEEKIANFFFGDTGSRSPIGLQKLMNATGLFGEGWVGAMPWGLILFIGVIGIEMSRPNSVTRSLTFRQMRVFFTAGFIALSLSLVGGLGSIFAITFSGILRGYARYSIFVLVLFVISIALYIESQSEMRRRQRSLLASFLIICIGMTVNQAPIHAGTKATQYLQSIELESSLEAKPGCTILQLPIMHFPYESPGYPTYSLMRFGLISDRYNWSSGFVGGSQAHVDYLELKEAQKTTMSAVIKIAKAKNYCGLLIDENVWDSVANFKPWPEYESGLGVLSEFIQAAGPSVIMKVIQTDDTKYFWTPIP